MMLMTAVGSMLGGAGATAGAATAGTAAAGTAAASGGMSIASILQGVATVGGVVASIAAGNAEAASLRAEAEDAKTEQGLETLQSVDRKRSLLKSAQEAVGEIDTAYAASGTDLSFGSAVQARQSVYREADLSLDSDSATTMQRLDRLGERARNLRRMARNARSMGLIQGLVGGAKGMQSIIERG